MTTKNVLNSERTVSAHRDMTGDVTTGAMVYIQPPEVFATEVGKFGGEAQLHIPHVCVSLNEDGSEPFLIPEEDLA